jgi:hypothetical protein
MPKIPFIAGEVLYRNTWKNQHGHIRVGLYLSKERAESAARTNATHSHHLYQEIGTPVEARQCLINPGIYNG